MKHVELILNIFSLSFFVGPSQVSSTLATPALMRNGGITRKHDSNYVENTNLLNKNYCGETCNTLYVFYGFRPHRKGRAGPELGQIFKFVKFCV